MFFYSLLMEKVYAVTNHLTAAIYLYITSNYLKLNVFFIYCFSIGIHSIFLQFV